MPARGDEFRRKPDALDLVGCAAMIRMVGCSPCLAPRIIGGVSNLDGKSSRAIPGSRSVWPRSAVGGIGSPVRPPGPCEVTGGVERPRQSRRMWSRPADFAWRSHPGERVYTDSARGGARPSPCPPRLGRRAMPPVVVPRAGEERELGPRARGPSVAARRPSTCRRLRRNHRSGIARTRPSPARDRRDRAALSGRSGSRRLADAEPARHRQDPSRPPSDGAARRR